MVSGSDDDGSEMRSSVGVRIINLTGLLGFGLCAWVQRNDLDPEIYHRPSELDALAWLVFYAVVAGCFLAALIRPVPRWLLGLVAVGAGAFLVRSAPGLWENLTGGARFTMTQTSMSASDPRVELSREFFGALLALAGTAWLWWQQRKTRPAPPPEN